MRTTALVRLGIACFFAAISVTASADEPAIDQTDPVAAEMVKLGAEYQKLQKAVEIAAKLVKEPDDSLNDEEWLRQGNEYYSRLPDPDRALLPRFLDLAKAHPESPYAIDALVFALMRGGSHNGDVHGEPWRVKEQAIDVLVERHLADPKIGYALSMIAGALPSQKAEQALRQAMENGPNETTRAAGAYHLANYFRNLKHAHERTKKIESQSRPAGQERYWKLVIKPYLEKFPYGQATEEETERILSRIVDEYPDVAASQWIRSGPHRLFLTADSTPRTYADLAKALHFELNHLVAGKPVPEIEGTDSNGERFRLSDYRGKVVLLTFSANWCGGCVQLYPTERDLVTKFRDQPFALLSVSRDEEIETLQASIAKGDITWRCWWDGMDGRIVAAWNFPGAPSLYLIDHEGVLQQVRISRVTPPGEIERVVASLVSKVPPAGKP